MLNFKCCLPETMTFFSANRIGQVRRFNSNCLKSSLSESKHHLGLHGTTWYHLGPLGTTWDHLGPPGPWEGWGLLTDAWAVGREGCPCLSMLKLGERGMAGLEPWEGGVARNKQWKKGYSVRLEKRSQKISRNPAFPRFARKCRIF